MPEYIYIWAYIQKHPQETKRLLGIEYPKLLELIFYGKLLKKEFEESKTTRFFWLCGKRCIIRYSI